jgi:hypothetical protein
MATAKAHRLIGLAINGLDLILALVAQDRFFFRNSNALAT